MAMGFKGPIGRDRLGSFAISRTIQFRGGLSNINTVKCKVCACPVDRNQGIPIMVLGTGGHFKRFFACGECEQLVRGITREWIEGLKEKTE